MKTRHLIIAATLLWLAGVALRLPILAVPPVLATMQADLAMSGTAIGILSGIPVALFAFVAIPASLMIARLGAVPALVVGLLIAAVGAALRLIVPDILTLFGATFIMGAGVAVMQPALPAVVRQWMPDRTAFATAVYTNGLIVGEIIPVAIMTPLVLPLVGDGWRAGLAFWALPLVAIAILIVTLGPREAARPGSAARAHWWPNWRDGLVWRLGLMLGCANGAYFGVNAFLPGYLTGVGRPDLISSALTCLNLGQLPASFLLLAFATRLERRAWPFVVAGVAAIGCIGGVVMTASIWTLVFAGALGFFIASTLVLCFALPPALKPPADIAPVSAAIFLMSYTQALLLSVIGGTMWDLTDNVAFAFLPLAVSLLFLIVLPRTISFRREPAGARSIG